MAFQGGKASLCHWTLKSLIWHENQQCQEQNIIFACAVTHAEYLKSGAMNPAP